MKTYQLFSISLFFLGSAVYNMNAQTAESTSTEQNIAALNNDFGEVSNLVSDSRLNGEWVFYNLYGEKVTGEERPYINIVNDEGRFYGSNGCNILNGTVVSPKEGDIQFTNILSTRKFCQNAPFEYKINVALDAVKGYSIKQFGHEYYLDLTDKNGYIIVVLRRHNMDFLNGAWRVTSINGELNRNEGVEIVIDIPEGRIHGNTGCNLLNGQVTIDPDKNNSIQFGNIGTTRMMCQDMQTETSFLVALEEVEAAYADGNNAASLYNSRGKQVLGLERINPEDQ